MSSAAAVVGASSGGPVQEQEFTVRIPARNKNKKYNVLKFNNSLNIDLSTWNETQVRMVRENNQKSFKGGDEEMPKFGAGSEFGREQKEEARRKKFGIISKKYKAESQPWLLRVGGKSGKKYKGLREGGVSDNTAYYVFTHAADGSFEAHPVAEWYNFTPIQRYKTLNAEEAEERFAERNKVLNRWSVMISKKLKPDEDDAGEDLDGEEKKKGKDASGESKLKISDMDDWLDSGDELDTDEDEEKAKDGDEDDGDGKKKKGGKDAKKTKKEKKVDDEAFEDSDDGDDEDREVDYMSDESSDSEEEAVKADIHGVEHDDGLAKMLESDDSEEEKADKKAGEDDEEKKKKDGSDGEGKKKSGSKSSSRVGSPTADDDKASRAEKRKAMVDTLLDPNALGSDGSSSKRSRLDAGPSTSSASHGTSFENALEEDVRRYLKRKPMTSKELMKKCMSKKAGMPNSQEFMPILVNIIKRINPHKQKVKGIMYLSLKPGT